jgi:hypothetical protein
MHLHQKKNNLCAVKSNKWHKQIGCSGSGFIEDRLYLTVTFQLSFAATELYSVMLISRGLLKSVLSSFFTTSLYYGFTNSGASTAAAATCSVQISFAMDSTSLSMQISEELLIAFTVVHMLFLMGRALRLCWQQSHQNLLTHISPTRLKLLHD